MRPDTAPPLQLVPKPAPGRRRGGALRRGHAVATAISPTDLIGAWARTGAFAARSARRVVLPSKAQRPDIPTRRPTLGVLTGVFAEELALQLASGAVKKQAGGRDFRQVADDAKTAIRLFDANGWLDDPASYHRSPPAPNRVHTEFVQHRKIFYNMVSFESGYEPVAGMPGRDRWIGLTANQRCYARVLEHPGDEPRPWLMFLHGSNMGRPSDLLIARAMHYHRSLGFNVMAPVLPLHGPRHTSGDGLISLDWVANVHGLTQIVWDVRRCLAWIRQRGATSIAMHGMSLGGYTTALVAGLDPSLDCVIAGLPASTIYKPLIAAAARSPHVNRAMETEGLLGDFVGAVHRVVTPTAFQCRVPVDRRFIYAGLADRVATPREPYLLWEHWEKPAICWSPNTHTLTPTTPQVRRFVRAAVLSTARRYGDEPQIAPLQADTA